MYMPILKRPRNGFIAKLEKENYRRILIKANYKNIKLHAFRGARTILFIISSLSCSVSSKYFSDRFSRISCTWSQLTSETDRNYLSGGEALEKRVAIWSLPPKLLLLVDSLVPRDALRLSKASHYSRRDTLNCFSFRSQTVLHIECSRIIVALLLLFVENILNRTVCSIAEKLNPLWPIRSLLSRHCRACLPVLIKSNSKEIFVRSTHNCGRHYRTLRSVKIPA